MFLSPCCDDCCCAVGCAVAYVDSPSPSCRGPKSEGVDHLRLYICRHPISSALFRIALCYLQVSTSYSHWNSGSVFPCTYVAEKPYWDFRISLTPPGAVKGLFFEQYRCKIMVLCSSHARSGMRCEYLFSDIVRFSEIVVQVEVAPTRAVALK
jgi:hypothetical protein